MGYEPANKFQCEQAPPTDTDLLTNHVFVCLLIFRSRQPDRGRGGVHGPHAGHHHHRRVQRHRLTLARGGGGPGGFDLQIQVEDCKQGGHRGKHQPLLAPTTHRRPRQAGVKLSR